MNHPIKALTLIAGLCFTPLALAHATYLKLNREIRLNTNGTDEWTVERELLLKNQEDIKNYGERSLEYNADTETVTILQAYSIQPNGTRTELSEKDIHDQLRPAAQGAPAFYNLRAKTLVFPNLVAGSHIYYKYRNQTVNPLFPGQHHDTISYDPMLRYDEAKGKIIAPASIALKISSQDIEVKKGKTANGENTWEWDFRQAENEQIYSESETVDGADFQRQLHYSTFPSWPAFAEAYHQRTLEKSQVTPAINRLAAETVASAKDRRDEARLLYQWVSQNIRYVQVYVNDGYYVPHTAEEVFNNRYGDCKDKAVLLKALLKARNIESSLVLINLGKQYSLPEIPTTSAFNHAILYLPDWNIYTDPTNGFLPFGVISMATDDKPVLHIDDGKGIQHTQPSHPDSNVYRTTTKLSIGEQGELSGTTETEFVGPGSADLRHGANDMSSADKQNYVRHLLAMAGLSGKGSFKESSAADLSDTAFSTKISYTLDQKIEQGSFAVMPRIGAAPILFQTLATALTFPYQNPKRLCPSMALEEHLQIKLPKTWKIRSLPKPVDIQIAPASYKVQYQLNPDSNTLIADWQGKFDHQGNTCDSKELLALEPLIPLLTRKDVLAIE